ncbi:MAG: UDP-2,3-diacetamido-2,3-dideoxy-D-glucuronate 2-epimerase [bacterium ADurb.Bin243]|nr:MAG: UDP-2,3-diacetamido-2,3-dideoxy-D-glucuronate 2-epimerase [bacterium ADurb.Bin243]
MIKIVTVAGNRPQFIKLAPVSAEIQKKFSQVIVHSGQHYDYNMSDIFFSQLDIRRPDYNLNVSEKSHAVQTAKILVEIEKILLAEKPELIIVFGDTNTTLAAALAAVKLHIPIAHIEAGPRMRDYCESPEEANRLMTDHISHLLFAPTKACADNLKNESVFGSVYFSGDTMYDTFVKMKNTFRSPEATEKFEKIKCFAEGDYVLMTLHRPLNVDDPRRLETIMKAVMDCGEKIIFPAHPRTREMMKRCRSYEKFSAHSNVTLIEPQGYIELGALQSRCKKIVTDSGGVAKEAYFNQKPCVTVYPMTPWPETFEAGCNTVLSNLSAASLAAAISRREISLDFTGNFFGNGKSASYIVKKIEKFIAARRK